MYSEDKIIVPKTESLQKSVGVDINTELIKLEQYKRQYEAIMKTIAAKDEMIGSLLAIV